MNAAQEFSGLRRKGDIFSRRMLNRIFAALIGLFTELAGFQGQTLAQSAATSGDPGVAVGIKAPAFKLIGQDGKEHTLAELLLKGKLALVFQRSADW